MSSIEHLTTDDVDQLNLKLHSLFVVSIDNKPSFYCNTLTDAQDQTIEYLRNFPKTQGYKYQIEKYNDYKFVLTSQYLFYVISYETTECNVEINEIFLKS
jgi:hypothetical protein